MRGGGGDALKAVQPLANASLRAPLRAGQIVTTGTASTPVRLGWVVADFGAVERGVVCFP